MIIVFPYCHKDQDQAVRLADWLHEIGPFLDHDLITVRDYRASAIPKLGPLSPFRSSKEIVISDDVHNSWPQSPNLMFSKAAKYVEYGPKQPWLWLEPDAIPLRASAFDEIETEYQTALANNKFFLGDFVHLPEPGFKDHCSGVAVYPPNMTHHAGDAVMTPEIAWDVAAARQILPKMFQSELILHRWKHPPFTSWEEVEQRIFAVRPKCALFHADKTGSLFPLLRERRQFEYIPRKEVIAQYVESKLSETNLPVPVLAESEAIPLPETDEARESITEPQSPNQADRQGQADSRGGQLISEDTVWLKTDAKGRVLGTFERINGAWRTASWPRIIANYQIKIAGPSDEPHLTLVQPHNCEVPQTPWASKADSLTEIQTLAYRLKQFGDNAGHVRAVRMILNDTGVITLPYRFKKRGKWRRKRKKKP